ncbi:MAG TPA: hypothetical protein PKH92_08215 [Anaerolineaceae bacterium]|nr:hypothetical protein [Anaerolineaceae bacterium]
MFKMVDFLPYPRSGYILTILLICLACLAIHVVVDSVGDFGYAQAQASLDSRPIRLTLHVHDDDFLMSPAVIDTCPSFTIREAYIPQWVVSSQAVLPQLPPPKNF